VSATLFALVEGTAVGMTQHRVLAELAPRVRGSRWLATVAGGWVAWVGASSAIAAMSAPGTTGPEPPLAVQLAFMSATGLAAGPVLGMPQALALRVVQPRPWSWIWGTFAAPDLEGPPMRARSLAAAVTLTATLAVPASSRVGGPNDAFGFGFFPGPYGMVVYSKYPIDHAAVRTFQHFLWKDMPGALLPDDPATPAPGAWYSTAELEQVRVSSKSHWDVPIQVGGRTVHFLVSHPTPPVFDGLEDRNGTRNHDEIRFWADYVQQRPAVGPHRHLPLSLHRSPAGVGRRAGARKGPLGAAGSGRESLAGLLRVLAAQHGDGTIVEETGVGAAVVAHHCCLAAEVDRLDAVRRAALARVVMVAPVYSSESVRCDCRAARGLSSRHGCPPVSPWCGVSHASTRPGVPGGCHARFAATWARLRRAERRLPPECADEAGASLR